MIYSDNFYKLIILCRNDGIDFRQHKQRREYAQKCFGDNPPLLNTLTVQSAPGPLHDKDISAMLPNATIKVE